MSFLFNPFSGRCPSSCGKPGANNVKRFCSQECLDRAYSKLNQRGTCLLCKQVSFQFKNGDFHSLCNNCFRLSRNLPPEIQKHGSDTGQYPSQSSHNKFPSGKHNYGYSCHINEVWCPPPIKFYDRNDDYYEFTNFYPCTIKIDGTYWPSTEHYFQAQKFVGTPHLEAIRRVSFPRQALDLSRRDDVSAWRRPDWESVKRNVMYKALLEKFKQHPKLRFLLVSTGYRELIEDSPIDAYWGCGKNGKGQNHLGKLLERVRDCCRQQYGDNTGYCSSIRQNLCTQDSVGEQLLAGQSLSAQRSDQTSPIQGSESQNLPIHVSEDQNLTVSRSQSQNFAQVSGSQDIPAQGSESKNLLAHGFQNQNLPTQNSQSQNMPSQGSQSQNLSAQGSGSQDLLVHGSGSQHLPAQRSGSRDLPAQGSGSQDLPAQGSDSRDLPAQGSGSQDLPDQGSVSQDLPAQGSGSQDLPDQGSGIQDLPDQGSGSHGLPQGSGCQDLSAQEYGSQDLPAPGSESQGLPAQESGSQGLPVQGSGSQNLPAQDSGSQDLLTQ